MTVGSHRVARVDAVCRAMVLAVLMTGAFVCLSPTLFPTRAERLQRRLIAAIHEQVPPVTDVAAELLQYAVDPLSIALAAETAALRSDHAEALQLYERLPRDGDRWEFVAASGRARRYERMGAAAAAEAELRRALELSPGHLPSRELLGHLLQVEGRVWEGAPHFFQQLVRGKCRGDELLGMACVERFFRSDDRLQRAILERQPSASLMEVGLARTAIFDGEATRAEALLHGVLAVSPGLGEAQGRLGRILVNRGDREEFLHWERALPDAARNHPEVWYVQGLAGRQWQEPEAAARCFLEALALSPNHLGATMQAAGCLHQAGRTDAARTFSERANRLAEFEGLIALARENPDLELLLRIAELAGELGRYWEAAGWCHVVTRLTPDHSAATHRLRHWLRLAQRSPAEATVVAALPQRHIRSEDFPLPRWSMPSENSARPATPSADTATPPDVPWQFEEQARSLGVDFTYYEGTGEQNRLEHIYNVMGGGLGSLDYDADGWPDLYVAQANNWRDHQPQPEWFDRLFRNNVGGRFEDVTVAAGIGDIQFSHGVTAGDFNQDGFPDLYVGNKGPNPLYRNNGDGTFTDVTDEAGVAGNDWTTSSVFADFNGDSLPDLYVLNYTLIDETARKECGTPEQQKACTPDVLPAADDRCYINLGDGRFRDVSREAGILLPDGKGLGVVAWDFGGTGHLGLFVANDTTPNFLFINDGPDAAGIPKFREEGVVRGVAYDIDGNAQASMGIAAGDVTGDGRIDLCLTDFFGSAIALYAQRADGFFDDVTRPYGLREPSLWMLGFGCHFGDFDGDGWDDLLVTNGHVDQTSSRGTPDRMPPQLFQNRQGRRFAEVPADRLGPFFQQGYLGRGLALWDWNRDGRTDAAISHLHAPAAILTNRTAARGQPLVVRLIGRRGCREPTGATVTLVDGERTQVRLMTAGDGFLATNERRLLFSVAAGRPAVELLVRWPDGHHQTIRSVPANAEVAIIEDAP
ncbi:MAG TPA: FG-GAP-like repeat-containing protein, partial [Planctomycetaceae bacterium]|nr:FG-GAP-like repeat-containing protein [Planctomycetaceae bacterium]